MQLNRLEFLAMNNPLRRLHLRYVELAIFKKFIRRHQIKLHNKSLLDAGCGSGYSTHLLVKNFNPAFVVGFDLMPEQAKLAMRRPNGFHFCLADLTQLPFKSQSFDSVFAFGILHHIADWRQGLAELNRILVPGGYLFIEEPNKAAVEFFGKYAGFAFPEHDRFGWPALEAEWEKNGLMKMDCQNIYNQALRSFLLQRR